MITCYTRQTVLKRLTGLKRLTVFLKPPSVSLPRINHHFFSKNTYLSQP